MDMAKRDKNNSSSKSRRRIGRRLLWAVGIALFLVLAFHLLIRVLFPEEKIRALISEQVQAATGRRFELDRISWSLLGSLDMEGVRLGFTEAENRPNEFLVRLSRARLRFRLLPLFGRKLQISDVLLDRPEIHLIPAVLEGPAAEPDSSQSLVETGDAKPDGGKTDALPVSMGLFRFRLSDFRLRMTFPDTLPLQQVELSGLNMNVHDTYIPANVLRNQDDLRGRMRLFTDKARLSVQASGFSQSWTPDIDLQAVWAEASGWRVRGGLHLRPESRPADSLYADLDIEGRGLGAETRIKLLSLGLGPWRPVRIQGTVSRSGGDPVYRMTIDGDEMDLSEVRAFMIRSIPAALHDPLERIHVSGRMSFLHGKIQGAGTEVEAALRSGVTDLSIALADTLSAGPVRADVSLDGRWNPSGLQSGRVSGTVDIGQVTAPLGDTSQVSVRGIRFQWNTDLDDRFFPAAGRAEAEITDLAESRLRFSMDWSAGALPSLRGLRMHGKLRLDSLFLENLPVPGLPLAGRTGVVLALQVSGLDSMRLELAGRTSGVRMRTDFGQDPVPDLYLDAEIRGRIEKDFSDIHIPSITMNLGELFSLRANARFSPQTRRFQTEITDARLENALILSHMPEQMRAGLAHLRIQGRERLRVRMDGALTDSVPEFTLSAEIGLEGGGLSDSLSGLVLHDLDARVSASGNRSRIEGIGHIRAGEIRLAALGPEPIRNSRLQFGWGVQNPDSLWIRDGEMRSDSLGAHSRFRAVVIPDDSIPLVRGRIALDVSSTDWKHVPRGIRFKGRSSAFLKACNDPQKPECIRIEGDLSFDAFSLRHGNLVKIANVQGRIPLRFQAGLDGRLIPEPDYEPIGWKEYEDRRDMIRPLWSGDRQLRIDSLQVNAYTIRRVQIDADFSRGMIQIPFFQMGVFEGNVGGSMWFDPADGRPENMQYGIRAQASRINSAALMEGRTLKESTELNANLDFTGRGLDVQSGVEVDGSFHITQIGPKFASTLLKGMDPRGSDRSIRLTRRLLDMGWKPRLFSFEMRHGHVYPSLSLSQPWFSPIRIPGRLEYGRIPFAFFLTNQPNMTQ